MNWWLILTAVLGVLLTIGVSVYIIFALTTPTELKTAIFPKIVALLGLTCAFCAVLLLPYEVANRQDPTAVGEYGGGIDTALMWQIMLWTSAALIIVVIPFAMFFYEAHDPEHFSYVQQCVPAALYTLGLVIVYIGLFCVLFYTIGYAVIPYYSYSAPPQILGPFDDQLEYTTDKVVAELELRTSAFVYCVGLLCFIGWLLFAVYGGVGLVAIPVGLIRYLYRLPKKPLTDQEWAAKQEEMAIDAAELIREGQNLQKQGTTDIKQQRKVNAFSGRVQAIESKFNALKASHEDQSMHYIRLFVILVLALIALSLTIVWILHIFFCNLVRLNPFLNVVLMDLDQAFSLLGVLMYAVLVFYLLWTVVAGNLTVGLRFTFFTIHPMRYRDTRVNSILFNVGLILTSAIAIIQFCAFSFSDYATNTAADALFDTWIRRLKYIGPVLPWLQVVLLSIFFLSCFWVLICPRKKKKKEPFEEDD
jgi:LMBR1 domain-containing protein 1